MNKKVDENLTQRRETVGTRKDYYQQTRVQESYYQYIKKSSKQVFHIISGYGSQKNLEN